MLPALVAHGYDRSIEQVLAADGHAGGLGGPPADPVPTPGLAGVMTWTDPCRVLLPEGVALDPGGIGKGLAADLVVAGLLARGAQGALVNLGGDAAVAGRAPEGDEWSLAVEGADGGEVARVGLRAGGIATSGRHRRRWRRGGRQVHHLIDPSTGAPATSDVVGATVVAGSAWWAEALTKVLVVGGSDLARGPSPMDAVVTRDDGSVVATGRLAGAVAGGIRRPPPGIGGSAPPSFASL